MNNISLPPFIMTSDEDSFAQNTIHGRKPLIIDMVLTSNNFTPDIARAFVDFKQELVHGLIQPLGEKTNDYDVWHEDLASWAGKSWYEIPWFLAEAYFYPRILAISRYFHPGPFLRVDPFELPKKEDIRDGLGVFEEIYPSLLQSEPEQNFREFCNKALWGNRGDLSLMEPVDTGMGSQVNRIILDQTDQAYQFLYAVKPAGIGYFFDNVGKELYFDLALIDHLLNSGLAASITCYVKNQPFFVSDAMAKDVMQTVDQMTRSDAPQVRQLSQRLLDGIKTVQIQIKAPPFFTRGRMYREMPEDLRQKLTSHDLVILKGDVNYRRLMGDRHWSPTTPVAVAAGYFPTAFLSLRTLKSELALGLTGDILNKVESEADPAWLTNGKRGLITFLNVSDKKG